MWQQRKSSERSFSFRSSQRNHRTERNRNFDPFRRVPPELSERVGRILWHHRPCSAGTLPERCQNALNKPQNKKPPCCADSIPVSYLLYAFVAVTLPLLCHCVLFDCLC